jgi:transcription elongation GreA/GreB family factor
VLRGETPCPLVRLGSRVRFRINDAPAEERTLVLAVDYRPDGHCLALDSPIGVALLGYQAGDAPAPRRDGVVVPFPGRPN